MNHYASGMFFDKGGRHYAIAKYMRREGYSPVVFCCNSKHGGNELFFEDIGLFIVKKDEEIDVPFVFVKGRPYSGNGKNRVLNMADFYFNVQRTAKIYAKNHGKPDVIYASSVHPLTLVAGIKLARYFGVKCICEVRDLWPESLVAYGILGSNNPVVVAMRWLEKWIYKKSHRVIFTAAGTYKYIQEQGWEKICPKSKTVYVNNGVDLEVFNDNKNTYHLTDDDLEEEKTFKIIYTGSVRKVNDVGKILDIAKTITNKSVKFLIWGDGDELDVLKKRILDENIDNVVFKGRVDKKYIPYITSKADINFAHNQSSYMFKYGISFNKLFDYLAAGKVILCDFECEYNPVIMGKAGISVDSGRKEDIARTIEKIVNMDNKEKEMLGLASKKLAEEYDYRILTKKIIRMV